MDDPGSIGPGLSALADWVFAEEARRREEGDEEEDDEDDENDEDDDDDDDSDDINGDMPTLHVCVLPKNSPILVRARKTNYCPFL